MYGEKENGCGILEFDKFYSGRNPAFGGRPTAEVMQYIAANGRGGEVLDLGCGDGRNALALAAANYRVTAFDTSRVAIEKLTALASSRNLNNHVHGAVADVRNWRPTSSRFDLIIAITILDHLPGIDIDPLVGKMVAALRKDGTLIVKVHTQDDPGYHNQYARDVSELAGHIQHYFASGELRQRLAPHCYIDSYEERVELDASHGEPHRHGSAVAYCTRRD